MNISRPKFDRGLLLSDLLIIAPEIYRDFRGEFVETFNTETYSFGNYLGREIIFVQDDISVSRNNVLRGIHGDYKNFKLVQCLLGEIFLSVVDNREESPAYLKVETFILSDRDRKQILIPPGFGNGYYCLSDKCIFSYKQTEQYTGNSAQFAMRWNDPKLGIHWPIVTAPVLSERDANIPLL